MQRAGFFGNYRISENWLPDSGHYIQAIFKTSSDRQPFLSKFVDDLSKIEEIYHLALEHPADEREAFLKRVCENDDELLHEVKSLLASHESAGSFFEQLPQDFAADFLASQQTENLVGKEFSQYRILSQLGQGGMGEVYLAQDTKLNRKVALKLLPLQFSSNTERKSRFEQEAHAVSALNHPNIITIHGIEKSDEVNFITTEYIEGQTLKEKIADKNLTWQETVKIGIQIAGALEVAHSVEIIHRDIKPANIMIRRDGIVKVLDFGLAKLIESKKSGVENNQSSQGFNDYLFISRKINTGSQNTNTGTILGTINYMSPEQALGQQVDERTDIFSFGVVLYEMLSGKKPFDGASDTDIYEATIKKKPSNVNELNSKIPLALAKIVKRTIEKNRQDRYQTAAQLRSDLERLNVSASLSPLHSAANYLKFFVPITALVLISAGLYFAFFKNSAESRSEIKFSNYTQFTTSGDESFPAISPDGKTVIFSTRKNGNWDVYQQKIGETNLINLTKNSNADNTQAVYSADGNQIAFRSEREGGGIFVMSATGENVRKVSEFGYYPSWSPDGNEIVFCSAPFEDPSNRNILVSALWIVNLAGGEKRQLYAGDAVQPSWSPNGERIAFWTLENGGNRDIKTISRRGGEPFAVTNDAPLDWNPVWARDGKSLYFSSNRGGSMNFWRISVDEKTGKTLGEPQPFTVPSVFSQNLSFSADGKLLVYAQQATSTNLVSNDFNPATETVNQVTTEITPGSIVNRNACVSPDGHWIAFHAVKDKQEDIFIIKTDGTDLRQLTTDAFKDRYPRWSPDGKTLIFYSNRSGNLQSWTISADGSNLTQVSFDKDELFSFYSHDGKKILRNFSGGYPKIYETDKAANEQTPFQIPPLKDSIKSAYFYDWSPDGRKLAGMPVDAKKGFLGMIIYDVPTGNYKQLTDFGAWGVWLGDSRRLVFFDKNKAYLLNSETGKTKEILTLAPNQSFQAITVAPDSRRLYYSLEKKESNIWLATVDEK